MRHLAYSLLLTLASITASADIADAVQVPAWLLEIPNSVTSVLVADTGSATLYHYRAVDGEIVGQDEHYMSIGVNGIRKQRAWDKKTPLGTYFVTERLDTGRMHDKYGAAAFPLDYPNAWDRYHERTGDGIWLHGVDKRSPDRPPLDTDGCLALPNDELLGIADDLQPMVTPVIVARDMRWASLAEIEQNRLEFRLAFDQWQTSQESGDLLAYLALYSEDFRHRGMDKAGWSAFRLKVFEARQVRQLEVHDLLLLADPVEPDLYLSRFTQIVRTDDAKVSTTKRLYWRRSASSLWRIVAEDAG